MNLLGFGIVGLFLGLAVEPASAEHAKVLFQFESWVVEGVTADDRSYSCRAKISVPGDSFSIRSFPNQTIRLEFYSEEWDLGEGETASLEVEIDDLSPWAFANATLLQSSVFVDLSDLEEGKTFVKQVAKGTTLYLRAANGTDVRNYTLSGSSDAIEQLDNCDQSVTRDSNPFN